MTNTFTVALLTICVMGTMACSLRGGTMTVHMDTSTRHGGIVDDVKHEDVQLDFVAKHINRGEFSWDNEWFYAELSSGDFKLYDEDGDIILVHLHEGQEVTKSLREILGSNAHSKIGITENIASHIGNSVDKAYLQKRQAEIKKADAKKVGHIAAEVASEVAQEAGQGVAKSVAENIMHKMRGTTSDENAAHIAGQVAAEVGQGVAQEVAKAVARNITHQFINTTTGEFKSSWKTMNEKLFTPDMRNFQAVITSKISV